MKKSKLVSSVLAFALLGLSAFVWYDIAPARASLNGVENSLGVNEGHGKDAEADLDASQACLDRSGFSIQFSLEERSCFLESMPRVKTYTGARVFGHFAYVWLLKYPHDEAVRHAALKAIDNGRADLIAQKKWMQETLRKNAASHNNSVILSFIHGEVEPPDVFVERSKVMDDLEFTVRLPLVRKKQESWMEDSYGQ